MIPAASVGACSSCLQPLVQLQPSQRIRHLPRSLTTDQNPLRCTFWPLSHGDRLSSSRLVFRASGKDDGMQRVQEILGRALKADKKSGFGPPPPNAEGGSGFINLSGLEDLMAGKGEFQQPSPPPAASPVEVELSEPSDLYPDSVPNGQRLHTALTPLQTVIAAGLVFATALAFGRSSEDFLPDSVVVFLQGWMALAWGGHALLGMLAATLAPGKGQPPLPWFFKVLVSGALAFQDLLALPNVKE